jgi:hypothetical protein
MSAELMLQAADALEKVAAYIDNTETERLNQETEVRQKEAHSLAEKISNAVGEPLDDDVVDKLATASPEVKDLLSRITGGDTVDYLGGPQEVSKVASAGSNHPPADAKFLDWVNS